MTNHLYDRLTCQAMAHSERILFHEPDGSRYTNHEVLGWVEEIGQRLIKTGVDPGDRVAIVAHKSLATLVAYLAIIRTGAIIVPLNPALTSHELRYFLDDSRPRVLIADDPMPAGCAAIIRTRDGLATLSLDRHRRGTRRDPSSPRQRGTADLAAILYSSGTTGKPKGVMLSHGALVANAEALVAIWEMTSADVVLHALPIFHLHGLIVATHVALLAGCEILFLPSFDPVKVSGALTRATVMMGVPTYYHRLLETPAFDQTNLQHMRLFITGSAPLPPDLAAAWQQRTGHALLNRYGMTEANIIASNRPRVPAAACSVGLPLPDVEVRIRDLQAGHVMSGQEPGALEIRGPGLFSGYWEMPGKTRDAHDDDGFFRTGDLARLAADGSLQIEGRLQDLIISGGMNVYPAEVEAVINSHPDTADAVVIGVPHTDYGEGVLAVVVRRAGTSLSITALQNHIRAHLSGYKCPKAIKIRNTLPRNAMEKVDRNALRKEYEGCFGS